MMPMQHSYRYEESENGIREALRDNEYVAGRQ